MDVGLAVKKGFYYLLIILAIFAVVYGLNELTQATVGVGFVCLGCFIGIIARICQAEITGN